MPANLTSEQVWHGIGKQAFAVLAFVTPHGEPRTAGIIYTVRDHELYVATGRSSWKARHIAMNPHVSLTVTIPKHIPFAPWIHIPPATITFQGTASIHNLEEVAPDVPRALVHGLEIPAELRGDACVIQIRPAGAFVTYGVGVSLPVMRQPEAAQGRVAIP